MSYTDLAESYDQVRFSSFNGRFLYELDREVITGMLAGLDIKNVLDCPTGTGRVLEYLSAMNLDVTGVDYTTEMLDEARPIAERVGATIMQGDASKLPFEDETFDCLISLRFFHLFDTDARPQFTSEFSRVVRVGGYALVSFTNGWYGGGLNWAKKKLGRKTVYFESRGEVQRLFPNFEIQRVRGNFLPKQYLFDRIPVLGIAIKKAESVFPVNRLCWERFYLLKRTR